MFISIKIQPTIAILINNIIASRNSCGKYDGSPAIVPSVEVIVIMLFGIRYRFVDVSSVSVDPFISHHGKNKERIISIIARVMKK